MARCTKCSYKWKIKELLSLGFTKKGRLCANCGTTQYMSAKIQNALTLGYLSLLFIPILLFFVTLSDKDEPLYK